MLAAFYDVIIIGSGPAGLAAALTADKCGAKTLLIERDANLGGILKQYINDGYGFARFGEKLTGPEYVQKFIKHLYKTNVEISNLTFIKKIDRQPFGFLLTLVNTDGVIKTACKSIVLACGCRERTSRQIFIHGRHTAGVITARTAQYYMNILGKMPAKRCVVLGSGDTGLVEVSSVDEKMNPVYGTEEIVECDTLVCSVGLIPENELAESLGLEIDEHTKGPVTDQDYMTMIDGVFCCGNALHINDNVESISENGEIAGKAAARWASEGWVSARKKGKRNFAIVKSDDSLLYIVPQRINLNEMASPAIIYFRSRHEMGKSILSVTLNGNEVYRRIFPRLRPSEMERFLLDIESMKMERGNTVDFSLSSAHGYSGNCSL